MAVLTTKAVRNTIWVISGTLEASGGYLEVPEGTWQVPGSTCNLFRPGPPVGGPFREIFIGFR